MNFALYSPDFLATYATRYEPPYWIYTVTPRNYEQPIYQADLDFAEAPYNALGGEYPIALGDTLEVFLLQHRVLVVGVRVEVVEPAVGLILTPITRSGVTFNSVDCTYRQEKLLAPFGGTVDRNVVLSDHSFVVEEPDYLGFRLSGAVPALNELNLRVTLSVSDEFSLAARTNSTKDS